MWPATGVRRTRSFHQGRGSCSLPACGSRSGCKARALSLLSHADQLPVSTAKSSASTPWPFPPSNISSWLKATTTAPPSTKTCLLSGWGCRSCSCPFSHWWRPGEDGIPPISAGTAETREVTELMLIQEPAGGLSSRPLGRWRWPVLAYCFGLPAASGRCHCVRDTWFMLGRLPWPSGAQECPAMCSPPDSFLLYQFAGWLLLYFSRLPEYIQFRNKNE